MTKMTTQSSRMMREATMRILRRTVTRNNLRMSETTMLRATMTLETIRTIAALRTMESETIMTIRTINRETPTRKRDREEISDHHPDTCLKNEH